MAMAAQRVLAFLALIAGVSSSQTSDCSYSALLKHLNLTTTNSELSITRPVKNWTTATLVLVDMLFYGILQVDEKFQTITSHIWIQMNWTNEFLTWNSSDFCGINTLTIPASLLWIPDVSIQEDASDTGSIYKSPLVSVNPNGHVASAARQRLTSTCKLNLMLFPFDKQTCNITFGSLSSDANIITIQAYNNDTTLTKMSELFMITHGEWQLRGMEINLHLFNKSETLQTKLTYTVTICRKPMLYVINFIVPLFYLLVLDLASFFISEAGGEKLSFKITILLSISVLLLILKDMLPSTEETLPMIANYCVAIFALVGLSVLEAMLMSFLTNLQCCSDKKAQSSADAEVEIQLEVGPRKEPKDKNLTKQERGSLPLDGPSSHELLKQIVEQLKEAQREVKRQDADKTETGFYRRLAKIIDSVFFVLYFLTVVVFLMCMYTLWLHHYHL